MEYEQICQRLSEAPLVVLQRVYHSVSEIYETRVQQNSQDYFNEQERNDAGYTTAHSSASTPREDSDTAPVQQESTKCSEANASTTNGANTNAEESESGQSGEVISADDAEAEAGGEDTIMPSRLRVRPAVKKITNRTYGIIVGVDSLKKAPPRKRSPFPIVQPGVRWTKQKFKRLAKGVELHMKKGWRRVAQHVGGAVTAQQCMQRWRTRAQFVPPKRIRRKWANAEVTRLAGLAKEHVIPAQWSESQQAQLPERVDWFLIAQKLKRSPRSCYQKYNAMQSKEQA